MKFRLSQILLISCLVSFMAESYAAMSASHVAAQPLNYVAAATQPCDLPDGSPDGVIGSDGRTCCPSKFKDNSMACLYAKYLNPLIALLSGVIVIVIVIAIIYGAIEYITSGGDPQRSAAGKKRITEALIGLIAFFLLFAFLQFLVPGGLFNNG